ncbi:hypothetical protein [Shewanella surugensis]|uniref:Uncharacterized protein n=1 Tax=Shewanella surugensis TaxID=212020 RepID=A0ABT0LK32_9GAMM|nr:hypothetical protein [Shewanella surugensis]MCL1127647.1 hypothetical protein [Shewanella surugensis]
MSVDIYVDLVEGFDYLMVQSTDMVDNPSRAYCLYDTDPGRYQYEQSSPLSIRQYQQSIRFEK